MTEVFRSALHRSAEHVVQDDNASCNKLETPSLSDGSRLVVAPRKRIVPPFILAHDLPRGIFYMFQATITYALMLAVMSVLSSCSPLVQTLTLLFCVGHSKLDTSSLSLWVWVLERSFSEDGLPPLITSSEVLSFVYPQLFLLHKLGDSRPLPRGPGKPTQTEEKKLFELAHAVSHPGFDRYF